MVGLPDAPPEAGGDRVGRPWREIVAPYARPDTVRGVVQLMNTGGPFLAILAVMLYSLNAGIWAALLLALPAAGFLVRLFAIQHDCGHGSFFKSPRANDRLGRILGIFTLTPYASWRKAHAMHHATSGNLDRRGIGDITTLTVREYLAQSAWRRFTYRAYRNPFVMFGIGPAFQFLIRHRIPVGNPLRNRQEWISVLGTNAAIAAKTAGAALLVGLLPALLGYLAVIVIAAIIGVWLFYVQHQFENTYWATDSTWDFHTAALAGSSFYDLPRFLHWITGSIGFHHIHHLSSRIPNYRLRECFEQNLELHSVPHLSLRTSMKCLTLALWDEERGCLSSFSQLRNALQPSP
ncbi:MAG: fatty acid desaturase [Proteobacteria bacterium]|nr:fatty acid desaturase [Pseudomonadota bacterium]